MPKKTFEAAEEGHKNLIVQLKDNQKELVNNCNDIVRFTKPKDEYTQENAERNRIEKRTIRIYKDDGFIEDEEWKKHIKSIFHVERTVQRMNTKTKQYEISNETSFYLSNKELTAKQAFEPIKKHWLIETNHYVRDVSMLEDMSRIRVNPDNMVRIRSFALNIMRKNKVDNIKGEMYQNSLCYHSVYSYQHFL